MAPFATLCAGAAEGHAHVARGLSAIGALALLVEVVASFRHTPLASASSTVQQTVVRLLQAMSARPAEWPPDMMGDLSCLVGSATAT